MKKLWGSIGTLLFWPSWPLLWLYFRFSGRRNRLLVVCDDEILLLKGWIGDKKFALPGGGCKKGESIEAGTVRELIEETGIVVTESSLVKLGSRVNKEKGLRYQARFFTVTLQEKPELKLPWYEIVDAIWVKIDEAPNLKLHSDAFYALKRYRPPEQASLL